MNEGGEPITLRVHGAIKEVPADQWDACAGDVNPTVSLSTYVSPICCIAATYCATS